MKIAFRELETTGDNIQVSFDNKNTFENYDKNTALAEGIPVPEECEDFNSIVVKTDELESSNLTYEISTDLFSQGRLSSKLDKRIKKLRIPEGVTSIGYSAFSNCSNLTSIEIPDSVTLIGVSAFSNCSNLTSINIPAFTDTIEPGAFKGCNSLISIDLSVNNARYSSDGYALYNKDKTEIIRFYNSSIDNFTIPNTVTSIGTLAFYSCSSLMNITIPNSVTSIDKYAFQGCSSLTSINISENNEYYSSDEYALYDKNKTKIIQFYNQSITTFTIPDSVNNINNNTFQNCSGLTSINIPDLVTFIGEYAFYHCSSLTSINIPNGVTSIGDSAFYDCKSLTSITIPDSVTSIGNNAFYDCSNLTSIEIPSSVTSIGNYAFQSCSGLTSINIPDSVTSIKEGAFWSCSNLTNINYRGTEDQWNNITKSRNWNLSCPAVVNYNYVD